MRTSFEYENQTEFKEFTSNDDFALDSLTNNISENVKKMHASREVLLWIRAFVFVILIVVVVRGFIGEPVKVIGPSMENTLKTGDVLIMSKINISMEGVKRNDIVVIEIEPVTFKYLTFLNDIVWLRRLFPAHSREDYIKRVIALEGEEISLVNGNVYIDGRIFDDPHVKDVASTFERFIDIPFTVPKGHVFVLGDNRLVSKDSRSLGAIPIESVIGKCLFRTWPLGKFGPLN